VWTDIHRAADPISFEESIDLATALAAILAYLLGSLSFAVIVSRLFSLADPRSYGSGNPGATNVLRSGHKVAAALTLLLDAVKGALPVVLVMHFGERYDIGEGGIALVALAVFLGHLYPVYFRFKGGKGVATALGILLALNPWLGLAVLSTWGIILFFFRYSSLAAMVAALFAPFAYLLMFGTDPIGAAIMFMTGLILYRHRGNMAKLIAGKESRIGAGRAG